MIHDFLANEAYWSPGVAWEVVARSLENALCFGVYHGDEQVGLARVISDFATFAYIADVFIRSEHRGKGLGKWLVETMLKHPDLQGLRKWTLDTQDAHGLYAHFGFKEAPPGKHMVYRPEWKAEQAQVAGADS
jgi:GNAT superfamily N-acetyltransferase